MKYLRHSLTAGALTLVLALPVFAGDMQCGFTSTSPTTNEAIAIDPAAEIALSLVRSVFALF